MSQINHQQRKQQVLTQVAQSRLAVLDASSRAYSGVDGVVKALPLNRKVLRNGALVGVALATCALARKLVLPRVGKLPKVEERLEQTSSEIASPLPTRLVKYIVAQLVSLVLVPWLRQCLNVTHRVPSLMDYWKPSRIFFRWIGLER